MYSVRNNHLFILLLLLLFYYRLQVSASKGHHQANIYKKKKLKILVHLVQKRQFYGIPFVFISRLYYYYRPLDVLSVVSRVEIIYCEYCGYISKIFLIDLW